MRLSEAHTFLECGKKIRHIRWSEGCYICKEEGVVNYHNKVGARYSILMSVGDVFGEWEEYNESVTFSSLQLGQVYKITSDPDAFSYKKVRSYDESCPYNALRLEDSTLRGHKPDMKVKPIQA